jgi:ubiquinone/menaquinone biosynthesis C-methylase UbiE
MAEAAIDFVDAGGYERFMGRWSRAVAPQFLRWMNPRQRARWLDVGCGTGILSEAVVDLCDPASLTGIDSSVAQIEQASSAVTDRRAKFKQADAMQLPFPDGSFDYAASALVINFIPDPMRAVIEMRRVTAPGGAVGGFVWDFGNELSPSWPLRHAMRMFGAEVPAIPGTAHSNGAALHALFMHAGLQAIDSRTIDVTLAYANLDDFWKAQTPSYSPTTKILNAMSESERRRLKRAVQEALPSGPHGKIEYSARANAIRANVPAYRA